MFLGKYTWTKDKPFRLFGADDDLDWQILSKDKPYKANLQKPVIKPSTSSKRKHQLVEYQSETQPTAKKVKLAHSLSNSKSKRKWEQVQQSNETVQPSKRARVNKPNLTGLKWDSTNWSCAYDCALTILFHIYLSDPKQFAGDLSRLKNSYMDSILSGFERLREGQTTFEIVRDELRHDLHEAFPQEFPSGQNGCDVHDILMHILWPSVSTGRSQMKCQACGSSQSHTYEKLSLIHYTQSLVRKVTSTQDCLLQQSHSDSQESCVQCMRPTRHEVAYALSPGLLVVNGLLHKVKIDKEILMPVNENLTRYYLKGIVYFASEHYSARTFRGESSSHLYDSIENNGHCSTKRQRSSLV